MREDGNMARMPDLMEFAEKHHIKIATVADLIRYRMEAPREILRACVTDLREMRPNREENFCCGGGGGLAVLETAEGIDREDTYYEFRMAFPPCPPSYVDALHKK